MSRFWYKMPPVKGRTTEEHAKLSIEQHRTDQIYSLIESLAKDGRSEFRPGHISDALREAGVPMLSWEIRGELARLEAAGLIKSSAKTGNYSLVASARKVG